MGTTDIRLKVHRLAHYENLIVYVTEGFEGKYESHFLFRDTYRDYWSGYMKRLERWSSEGEQTFRIEVFVEKYTVTWTFRRRTEFLEREPTLLP